MKPEQSVIPTLESVKGEMADKKPIYLADHDESGVSGFRPVSLYELKVALETIDDALMGCRDIVKTLTDVNDSFKAQGGAQVLQIVLDHVLDKITYLIPFFNADGSRIERVVE